ncbi:MAG TPA: winged helix-turn-helix domain-containing protein [Chloroflexota bacterium]|nr:winged helix-turn-helix domain-containing protein [Chloroflexota bacterium]
MLSSLIDPESRAAELRLLYARLRFAESFCVVGQNDIGKTTLLALAQQPAVVERYAPKELQRDRLFVHVDCNLLAGSGPHELYTLLAEGTRDAAQRAGRPIEAPALPEGAVMAALALERVLDEAVQAGFSLVYLIDEFEELYRRLEARALLSLRAYENRIGPRLAYVVALERPLREVRGSADVSEFEEMFLGGTHTLEPLSAEHAIAFVGRFGEQRGLTAAEWLPELLLELSGGHPGLLWAGCAAAQRLRPRSRAEAAAQLPDSPELRTERANVFDRAAGERGLVVDTAKGEVRIDGAPPATPLGPTEYRLLQALAAHNGALVSKDDVAREVWPQEQSLGGVDDARIDKLIDRVRSKIEPDAKAPRYLITVRGLGYRLLTRGATA